MLFVGQLGRHHGQEKEASHKVHALTVIQPWINQRVALEYITEAVVREVLHFVEASTHVNIDSLNDILAKASDRAADLCVLLLA